MSSLATEAPFIATPTASSASPLPRHSVEDLFERYERKVFDRANRLFCWLLPIQWIFAMAVAVIWSPLAWSAEKSTLHPHLVAAIGLGGLLVAGPICLVRFYPYHVLTRHMVAVAQVSFSALLIHLMGGRLETHFHVFGSLAFLTLYRDWRVLQTATVVVALDHLLRGIWFPESVYGVSTVSMWRTLEHAGWVIFEDIVLILSCLASRKEMWEICQRQDAHQTLLDQLEERVRQRTRALENEMEQRKRSAREVELLNRRLLDASRQAGMAEVATGILHNVGNVLNSVNISTQVMRDTLERSQLPHLGRVADMIRQQGDNLGKFIADDPKGRILPPFIVNLSGVLAKEQQASRSELDQLVKNIEHIKEIVSAQQSFAKTVGITESVSPRELFDEAERIAHASALRHGIEIAHDYADLPAFNVDRHRTLQILVNFITNAIHAVKPNAPGNRRIALAIEARGGSIAFRVKDNGVGISAENLNRVFTHGFTTRRDGHGFGLHSGALAAKLLQGEINVESEGVGHGAHFTLLLPTELKPRAGTIAPFTEPAPATS